MIKKVNEPKNNRMVTDAASKGAMIAHTGIEYISLDMRKCKRLNNLPSSPYHVSKNFIWLKATFCRIYDNSL